MLADFLLNCHLQMLHTNSVQVRLRARDPNIEEGWRGEGRRNDHFKACFNSIQHILQIVSFRIIGKLYEKLFVLFSDL